MQYNIIQYKDSSTTRVWTNATPTRSKQYILYRVTTARGTVLYYYTLNQELTLFNLLNLIKYLTSKCPLAKKPLWAILWYLAPNVQNGHACYIHGTSIFMKSIPVDLGGLGITCSPRDPRFAGSNPTVVDGFFQDVKILSTSPPGGTLGWGSRVLDFRLVKEPQA